MHARETRTAEALRNLFLRLDFARGDGEALWPAEDADHDLFELPAQDEEDTRLDCAARDSGWRWAREKIPRPPDIGSSPQPTSEAYQLT